MRFSLTVMHVLQNTENERRALGSKAAVHNSILFDVKRGLCAADGLSVTWKTRACVEISASHR